MPPPIINDEPQALTEASLRKAGFVRSTVSGEWIRRDARRAYFKAVWDAMDTPPVRRSGMTAGALDIVERGAGFRGRAHKSFSLRLAIRSRHQSTSKRQRG